MSDISVIICTRDRADSLQITLECLCAGNRDGIDVEIIVVDNGSGDHTREVVRGFQNKIRVRYLHEPGQGVYGKSYGLNTALNAGGLGEIIATLDDDMSPRSDWFQGVMRICNRWPDKDIFGGRTHIIWPSDNVPDWSKKPSLHSWIYSSLAADDADAALPDGRWFSGNHFWFRSRVLESGIRFKDMWLTEPDFMLSLAEMGFSGVAAGDAVAGHRVQPQLLDRGVVLARARKTGMEYAVLRLQPYRAKVKQARLFRSHPLLARSFCLCNYLRWSLLYGISFLQLPEATSFEKRLIALERLTTYRSLVRVANQFEEYSIWKRRTPHPVRIV